MALESKRPGSSGAFRSQVATPAGPTSCGNAGSAGMKGAGARLVLVLLAVAAAQERWHLEIVVCRANRLLLDPGRTVHVLVLGLLHRRADVRAEARPRRTKLAEPGRDHRDADLLA